MSILISGKTILIAPIDWGLGHATRCVPLIRKFSEKNSVIIGTTALNVDLFNAYFPELKKVELPSYAVSYSRTLPLWLKLVLQWPGISRVIKKEKALLETLRVKLKIDVVISDNRFGLFSPHTRNIFISHQLHLKTPFFSSVANRINRKFIHQFDEVWVPDHKEIQQRLSGELSDPGKIRIPVTHIGPQSALEALTVPKAENEKFDYLLLLSGVEPQRQVLEDLLLKRFSHTLKRIALVRGSRTPCSNYPAHITVVDLPQGAVLKELILNSETIICRSGYSTLMDLHLLRKQKLILIPTPGQSEQEYLATYWSGKFGARKVLQKEVPELML